MMMRLALVSALMFAFQNSSGSAPRAATSETNYLDNSGREDVLSGGVKMIPFRRRKALSASGPSGSAITPGSRCCFCTADRARRMSTSRPSTAISPAAGIEYYYYDQLGSAYSDQPDIPELWELPRFVEEVEQVRQALGLDRITSIF